MCTCVDCIGYESEQEVEAVCPACKGSGESFGGFDEVCATCKGSGYVAARPVGEC